MKKRLFRRDKPLSPLSNKSFAIILIITAFVFWVMTSFYNDITEATSFWNTQQILNRVFDEDNNALTFRVSGALPIGEDLTVGGAAQFNLRVGIIEPPPIGVELYVAGDEGISGDLTVGGTSDLQGDVSDSLGTLTIDDDAEIASDLTLKDTTASLYTDNIREYTDGNGIEVEGTVTLSSDLTLPGTTSSVYTGRVLATDDTSGVLTLGGSGGTNNENITLDFETSSNRVTMSSSSGTDRLTFPASFAVNLFDGGQMRFGSSGVGDSAITWETEGNDNLQIGTAVGAATASGYISIMEAPDFAHANRSPLATSLNPVLRVYSSDATSATDYIEMYHDQSNATIKTGEGSIAIDAAANGLIILDDGTQVMNIIGSVSHAEMRVTTKDETGNQVVLTKNVFSDHDHAVQENPTLYIHSDQNPDDNNTGWLSLTHDYADGVIDVGSGKLRIEDSVTITGNLTLTGTVSIDQDLTLNGTNAAFWTGNIPRGDTQPGTCAVGQMWFDTDDKVYREGE